METAEIDDAIKELDSRLDRLRALYEQYFMGIEKLEPLVPRKDVERRFQVLRKVQIRNTAQRFRFHMTLQRYNTYQSYWVRICRQLEEGTYRRDVRRTRARFAEQARAALEVEEGDGPSSFDLAEDFSELEGELAEVLTPAPAPRRAPPPVPPRSIEPGPLASRAGAEDRKHADDLAAGPRPQASAAPPPGPQAPRGFGSAPRASESRMKMLAVRLKSEREAAGAHAAAPPPAALQTPAPAPRAAAPGPPAPRQAAPAPQPANTRPAGATAVRATGGGAVGASSAGGGGPAGGGGRDLTDDRVRQLYGQYVDARRKQNESTASLTLESMARTLRESSAKLREKHGGKSVDFEVTVKDGKTILKPVVK